MVVRELVTGFIVIVAFFFVVLNYDAGVKDGKETCEVPETSEVIEDGQTQTHNG